MATIYGALSYAGFYLCLLVTYKMRKRAKRERAQADALAAEKSLKISKIAFLVAPLTSIVFGVIFWFTIGAVYSIIFLFILMPIYL